MAPKRSGDDAEFDSSDLQIKNEVRLGAERWKRLSAARWVAIGTLAVVGLAALFTLFWYPTSPPSWAQPTLASILTAAVAFLFSERDGGGR